MRAIHLATLRLAACSLALVALLWNAGNCLAEKRTWKDVTGQHSIEAELVEVSGRMVRLKRTDGREISLAIDKLSGPDRVVAMRQWRMIEAVPPQLSVQGKELVAKLVADVQKAAGSVALTRLRYDTLENELAPALRTLMEGGRQLAAAEGRAAAVAPAIVELLGDRSPAVRAVAAKAATDLDQGMVSAAPAFLARVSDENELVANLSRTALHRTLNSSDAAVPVLVSALQDGPEDQAKAATTVLVESQQTGPHAEAAVPRLAAMLADRKLPVHRRAWAGYVASALIENLGEQYQVLAVLHMDYDEQARLVQQQKAQARKIIEQACRVIEPLLTNDENAELVAIAFSILASHSKPTIQALPADKMGKLIETLESASFNRELMNNVAGGPVELLTWHLLHGKLRVELPVATSLRLLASDHQQLSEIAQAQLVRSSEKSPEVIPELVKMVREGKTTEARVSALQVLRYGAIGGRPHLSSMPIHVKGGRGRALELASGDKKLADFGELAAAIRVFQPPKRAGIDVDAVLKEAANDPDDEVAAVAIQSLAARGTTSAKAALRELERTALRTETRRLAQQMLQSRDELDRYARPRAGEGSPFDPRDPQEKRPIAVELLVEGTVPMQQVVTLIQAALQTDATGVRLAMANTKGDPGARVEIQMSSIPQHHSDPSYTFVLEERTDPAVVSVKVSTLQHAEQSRRPPDFEALQFALSWSLADQFRSESEYQMIDQLAGIPVGAGSLPILAAIRCEPGATFEDGLQLLTSIARSHEGVAKQDMIQWVRFQTDSETLPVWYVKASPMASEK